MTVILLKELGEERPYLTPTGERFTDWPSDVDWAKEPAEKLKEKMIHVARRNKDKIPYRITDGRYNDMIEEDITWWTNGFWGGILWQMYNATGNEEYRQYAEYSEEKMEENLHMYRGMDHDNGFKWLLTAAANYRLTGSEKAKDRALIAANSLAGRFNLTGNFIRAWNDNDGKENTPENTAGWAIIDCMMNLPLLYWASEELKDPRFRKIAQAHADMAMKVFVRGDGSVHHVTVFDPETGEILGHPGGQGSHTGSSWTRGEAWAVYGYALSYVHTQKKEYLDTAKRVAHYFMANIPESGLIPVDFRQPADCTWQDDTAAAIAVCGLLEIEKYVDESERGIYHRAAEKMLKALIETSCCWDSDKDYLLENCTAAYHDDEHNFPMMYADYFFIEAILKLTGEDAFLW